MSVTPHVNPRVAVLGGGWAGMAAAVTLADAGVPVTVYEAARILGGRARRVDYNGMALDNGLHVVLGAYRETLRMIERVGAADGLRREPLDLHIPGKFRLRTPPLPAPLHLAVALLWSEGLTLAERLRAARFVQWLRAGDFRLKQDSSVAALLARGRQPPAARRYLWEPLCVSALNTGPDEASAQVFLNVLRDGLNGTREDSEMLFPRRDWSALFPEPAAQVVRCAGGEILLGCTVEAVRASGHRFTVRSPAGEHAFDCVICALPPYRVAEALGPLAGMQGALAQIASLRHEPIYSVFLQYEDGVRLPQSMLGLDGGLTQWVFDRGRLSGQAGLLGVVISARGAHQDVDQDRLAVAVQSELALQWPALGKPRWSKVIAEKRATFACTAGVSRPVQRTPVPGLYLAGDYTASPYPATLEAAVRSGIECARMAFAEREARTAGQRR